MTRFKKKAIKHPKSRMSFFSQLSPSQCMSFNDAILPWPFCREASVPEVSEDCSKKQCNTCEKKQTAQPVSEKLICELM